MAQRDTVHDDLVYREAVDRFGLTDIRHMRIRETTGVDAWLTITRNQECFTKRDSKLLEAIAPLIRGVLQLYVAMERERFAASLTAEAVRRLQFGWIALSRTGQVLQFDEQAAVLLTQSNVLGRSPAGRLTARPYELECEIFQALERVAKIQGSKPRAITLSREPWLDMLILPARRNAIATGLAPDAIAYVHGDNWHSGDRCQQLAELFDLSPREAKMALALSRGMTITEAAAEFNLTVGSARMYSKQIYAKTGARGLPDLVRIVMRSVLSIMPDA
jgi:DNA-binding CsgD family transcriptional regulator